MKHICLSEEVLFILEEEDLTKFRIAGKFWGDQSGKPCLLIHGNKQNKKMEKKKIFLFVFK